MQSISYHSLYLISQAAQGGQSLVLRESDRSMNRKTRQKRRAYDDCSARHHSAKKLSLEANRDMKGKRHQDTDLRAKVTGRSRTYAPTFWHGTILCDNKIRAPTPHRGSGVDETQDEFSDSLVSAQPEA